MHAKSGGSSGEPPDFLFIPAACRSRKDLPRSAGGGDRARNAGNRPRDAEDGATGTGTGAGCGARETGARETGARAQGAGPRVRNTEDAGVGRRTQNAEHVDADADAGTGTGARGHGVQDAGRRTQDAERRTQNAGRRTRATGRGQQNTGNGGTKCRRRKTRARGAGRRTRATGRGQQNTGNAGTGRRRRGIGDGAQAPVHGTQRDSIRPARPRNNRPGPFTAGRLPPPGPIRRDLSRLDARRRDPQQPAGAIHSRAPSATGTCNNPPGPSTAGRLPPRAAATCRAYESESRRCRRARRTCCCRAAPRPT